MPNIVELREFDEQPKYPVLLDRENPLSTGFTSFLYPVGGSFFDACVSPLKTGIPTALTIAPFFDGEAFEFNGTSSAVNFGDVETVNFGGAYSIFILFRPDAQVGARREMLFSKDTDTGRQFTIELNPQGISGVLAGETGAIGHTRFVTNTNYFQKYSAANVVANGSWYSLLIGSTDGTTDIVSFLNGVSLALPGGGESTTGLTQNTTTELFAGRRNYPANFDYFDGGIALIATANIAPSQKLAIALYENPWQLLAPEEVLTFFPAAAGDVTVALTGQSITAAQGSLSAAIVSSITGQAVSAALGTVSPNVVVALSGQAVQAAQGTIVAGVATPLTGQAVQAALGSVRAAVEVALTGQAVTAALGDVGVAGDIVRALTGQSVTAFLGSVSVVEVSTKDTHDGFLPHPVKRRKQSKEVRAELEQLFQKAEIVVEKIAAKVEKAVPVEAKKVVDIGIPPLTELQTVLMHLQMIQDAMTGPQMQRLVMLKQTMERARRFNILARAALLAA